MKRGSLRVSGLQGSAPGVPGHAALAQTPDLVPAVEARPQEAKHP